LEISSSSVMKDAAIRRSGKEKEKKKNLGLEQIK
jgi:hypothetical protein